jgi:prepilin-type N-terminal cleavage/methylation domain-containing protein
MNRARNTGFTLVELLVVMAIIAILASIVVPNVIGYIRGSRETKAHSEIRGIELALSKMVADVNRHSLRELFKRDPNTGQPLVETNRSLEDAITIYSEVMYALLREGRQVLTSTEGYGQWLETSIVQRLGTNYMDIGFDPWGQLYQFFPGPWTDTTWANQPIAFRLYLPPTGASNLPGTRGGAQNDKQLPGGETGLTVTVTDAATGESLTVGYTAPPQKSFYIWSRGENTVTDQGVRVSPTVRGGDAYVNPDEIFWGGGDDINNWDNDRSWARFYN